MHSKRNLAVFATCMMLMGTLTVPALAHGNHHNGHGAGADSYAVCPVEDCQATSTHSHDGVTYCGHTPDDGHGQHAACGVAGCAELGSHIHKGSCGAHHNRHC